MYPTWANVLGWGISASSILMIPTVAIIQFWITPGCCAKVSPFFSCYEFNLTKILKRFKKLTTPWQDTQMANQSNGVVQSESNQVRLASAAQTPTEQRPVEV